MSVFDSSQYITLLVLKLRMTCSNKCLQMLRHPAMQLDMLEQLYPFLLTKNGKTSTASATYLH